MLRFRPWVGAPAPRTLPKLLSSQHTVKQKRRHRSGANTQNIMNNEQTWIKQNRTRNTTTNKNTTIVHPSLHLDKFRNIETKPKKKNPSVFFLPSAFV